MPQPPDWEWFEEYRYPDPEEDCFWPDERQCECGCGCTAEPPDDDVICNACLNGEHCDD